MDIRQGPLWAKYLQELGWNAEKISPNCLAYTRRLPLLGSIIKIPRAPVPIPFEKIDSLAKKNNALFVKLEPDLETGTSAADKIFKTLKKSGYVESSWSLTSSSSFEIDLSKSEAELFKSLEKDTRYSANLAKRKGVTVKEVNDIEGFKKIYFDTAKRKGFWPAKAELSALWKTFSPDGSAKILTAYYKNKPIATTLLLFSEENSYYYHAASIPINREVMAPYLLLWEAILLAKKRNCKIFDLEGIKDDRFKATKGWGGFTHFKKGFGGRKVEYLGSFTKYYKPWAKIFFSLSNF